MTGSGAEHDTVRGRGLGAERDHRRQVRAWAEEPLGRRERRGRDALRVCLFAELPHAVRISIQLVAQRSGLTRTAVT